MQIGEQEKWLYNRKFDSLESILSSFSNIKYKAINWMFIWCKSDIRRILKNTPDDCIVNLEYEEQPFFTIQISQTSKEDKKSEVVALCISSKINSLFIVLNDSKFANFKRLMDRIINHNYLLLSRG